MQRERVVTCQLTRLQATIFNSYVSGEENAPPPSCIPVDKAPPPSCIPEENAVCVLVHKGERKRVKNEAAIEQSQILMFRITIVRNLGVSSIT